MLEKDQLDIEWLVVGVVPAESLGLSRPGAMSNPFSYDGPRMGLGRSRGMFSPPESPTTPEQREIREPLPARAMLKPLGLKPRMDWQAN